MKRQETRYGLLLFLVCFISLSDGSFEWTQKPKIITELIYGQNAFLRWNYSLSTGFNFLLITRYQDAKRSYSRQTMAIKKADGRVQIYADFKGHIDVIDKATLKINKVEMNDETIYCCEVHYTGQSTISCAQAFVLAQPVITHISPKSSTVLEGSDTSLYCNATGIPVPFIEWHRKDLPDQRISTGNTLRLLMTRDNSGGFVCKASNKVGSASATAYVNVQYPARAVVRFKTITANQSDVVKSICHVTGNPRPSIKWTKIGNTKDVLSWGSVLTINITGKSDQGRYQCQAKNRIGNTSADITTINVQNHAPFNSSIETCPLNKQLIEKQTFVMECSAIASPPPTYYIYHNQKLIKANRSGYHKICRTKRSQAGNYTCIPINSYGAGKRATLYLDVQYPPTVTINPKFVHIKEGEVAILECAANGNPYPNIIWEKEGSSEVLSTDNVLVFKGTRRKDTGNYTCKAYNGIGTSVRSWSYLEVYYAPEITIQPANKAIRESLNTSLYCEAVGNPKPQITWIKQNGKTFSIENASEGKLKFINVSKSDAGIYVCTASNFLGNVSVISKLDVQYKPSKTKLISSSPWNTVKIKDPVTIYCVTDANPPANLYNFYHNANIIAKTNSEAHHLVAVEKEDEGLYSCKPVNVFGVGNIANMFLRVKVPPSIEVHPQSQEINEGDTLELRCVPSGDPFPNITWTMSNSSEIISNESVLILKNITRYNGGTYVCMASNGVGKNDIAEAKISVNYKPTITASVRRNQRKYTGTEIELSCTAKGRPYPAIVWFPLPENATVVSKVISKEASVSTLKFKIKKSSKGVKAIYCLTWNAVGNDLANVTYRSVPDKTYSEPQHRDTWFGLSPLVVLGIMTGFMIGMIAVVVMASIYRQHRCGKGISKS